MATRKQIKILQEKKLRSISPEDKATIKKIVSHYKKLGELLDTLSPDAQMNLYSIESLAKGRNNGSVLDVGAHEIVLIKYLDFLIDHVTEQKQNKKK